MAAVGYPTLSRVLLRQVVRAWVPQTQAQLALTLSLFVLLQRSPVQANNSTSKTAGTPAATVQQLQVHSVQQSVPVTQEVPDQGGQ